MIVIGRKDKIDLPELGLTDINAKIDTGAYGCALHCHHVEVIRRKDKEVLSFMVLDPSHNDYEDKVFYVEKFKDKLVKSSSGEQEHRYTFETKVTIFNQSHIVEFSLTDRKKMKYPILLGRKLLSKRYIVDVQLKDVSFQIKKKQYK